MNDADTLLRLSVSHGATLRQFVSDSAVSVILVQSPAECLTCTDNLSDWVNVANSRHGQLAVILTQDPDSNLSTLLGKLRITHATLTKSDAARVRGVAPIVAVFVGRTPLVFGLQLTTRSRAALLDSTKKLLHMKNTTVATTSQ
ncbi:MAG: hypothetical protein ABJB74_05110 [Gemmatimonas sp.]